MLQTKTSENSLKGNYNKSFFVNKFIDTLVKLPISHLQGHLQEINETKILKTGLRPTHKLSSIILKDREISTYIRSLVLKKNIKNNLSVTCL